MIRPALAKDMPQLKALWMEAFGDSQPATDYYFRHRFIPEGMLVLQEDGQVQGMLSMLPITLALGERRSPARYLFAIATDLRFRGQGISTRLIEQALEQVQAAGDAAALLVPAGEDLFRFYGKRGFETRFFIRQRQYLAGDLPPCPSGSQATPLKQEDMLRLRDAAFLNHGLFARWGVDALRYILGSGETFGAVLLRLSAPGGEGYVFAEWQGDTLLVKELAAVGMTEETALSVLHSRVGAARYAVRLKDREGEPGQRLPFGMWVPFDPGLPRQGPGWLGLAKD